MKTLLPISIILLVFCAQILAEDETTGKPGPSEWSTAPRTLAECYDELNKVLPPETIEQLKNKEIHSLDLHMGAGGWIRNNWGLWHGSALALYFNELGIFHADDMSCIILESYSRQLRNEPIDLASQVAYYIKYWKDIDEEEARRTGSEPGASHNDGKPPRES